MGRQVIRADGKILALMEPSKTGSFINYMKNQNFQSLLISIQDQLVVSGLIAPHIHAIGGGGEQGMFGIQHEGLLRKCHIDTHPQSFRFFSSWEDMRRYLYNLIEFDLYRI
jgi:hypothetical protein